MKRHRGLLFTRGNDVNSLHSRQRGLPSSPVILKGNAMAQTTTTAKFATTHTEDTRPYVLAFAIVVAAEFIGILNFSVGPGKIVLLPMLWALLIGGVWSMAESWLPGPLQALQRRASAIVQLAVLLFAAKLGLLVGGSLPKLATAGWALLFQEFGHFFGTMAIGLPIALLLGIKREAIGATFSVGREPSLAIIGEKYGMHSPEGRGVLAEYITGTIFGAVFIIGPRFAGFQSASSSFTLLSRNLTSSGLVPGPPAKCPQTDGIGMNLALGMLATSNSLSSGGK